MRRFELRIEGSLSARTRGAFRGMAVVDAAPETIVAGEVRDDAHLHGVLLLIRALGLRLVSVREVPPLPRE
jgi:hypothetical protein